MTDPIAPARTHESTPPTYLTLKVNGVSYRTEQRSLDGVIGGQRVKLVWDGKTELTVRIDTREPVERPVIVFGDMPLTRIDLGLGRDGVSLLVEAAVLFRAYEAHHRGRLERDPTGASHIPSETLTKAESNAAIAARIEAHLRLLPAGGLVPALEAVAGKAARAETRDQVGPDDMVEAIRIIGGLLDCGFQPSLVTRARRWLDKAEAGKLGERELALHDALVTALERLEEWAQSGPEGRTPDEQEEFDELYAVAYPGGQPGRCQICGCDEEHACEVAAAPGDPDAAPVFGRPDGEPVRPCRWTDATRTLCDAPACLEAFASEDEGCPKGDPDCLGGDGDCHDACVPPETTAAVEDQRLRRYGPGYAPDAGGRPVHVGTGECSYHGQPVDRAVWEQPEVNRMDPGAAEMMDRPLESGLIDPCS